MFDDELPQCDLEPEIKIHIGKYLAHFNMYTFVFFLRAHSINNLSFLLIVLPSFSTILLILFLQAGTSSA